LQYSEYGKKMNNTDKKEKKFGKSLWHFLIRQNVITSLIIAFLIFLCGNIIWPTISKTFFNHIRLAAVVRPSSTILIDGNHLNLELTCQLTNHTSFNIEIHQFRCYYRKNNFWTKLRFKNNRAGKVNVMNFESSTEISNENLPPEAFGIYNVYINIPLPEHIEKITKQWYLNDYQLTYQQLIEKVALPEKDIVLVVKTNPDFEDDAIIHLFQKQP